MIFISTYNLPYEKVGKNEPVCIVDEVPFEIPDSWEWARCSSIGSMIRGKGIKRGETVSSGRPCLRYGEIYTSYSTCFDKTISFIPDGLYSSCNLITRGDVVFTLTGENKPDIAKAIAYVGNEPVAAGGDLAYWTAHGMNPLYLTYYLNGPYCIEMKKRLATGDIIVHISTDKVGSFLIPIPPLKEQDRIVEQIHLIEPLISEYSKCDESISDLSRKFPEMLKKSILQQAVMGKLVPQAPNDEPASILLERIRAEKQELIKAGKLKKDKHESIIYRRDNSHYEKVGKNEPLCIDDEVPFEIPDSWEWARLGSICTKLVDGDHNPPKGIDTKSQYLMASSTNINNDSLVELDKVRYLSESVFEKENERTKATAGDIFFTSVGSLGRSCIYDGSLKICFQRSVSVITTLVFNEYLKLCLDSDYIQSKVQREATGTAQKGFYLNQLANLLIPVPPLSEQKRIVAFTTSVLPVVKAL